MSAMEDNVRPPLTGPPAHIDTCVAVKLTCPWTAMLNARLTERCVKGARLLGAEALSP